MQLIWTCTSFVAKDTTLSFTGLLSLLLLVQAAPSDRQSSNSPLLLPRRYETCWPAFLFPPPAEWTSSSAGEAGRPTDLPGGSPPGRRGAWLEAGKARPRGLLPSPAHPMHTSCTQAPAPLPPPTHCSTTNPFFRSHWSSISSSSAFSHNTFPSFHPPQ